MKALASHDRPREKLARAGAEALGDNELVAVLLGSGTRGRSSLDVANVRNLELVGQLAGCFQVHSQARKIHRNQAREMTLGMRLQQRPNLRT